jgi:hypothetical protein
VQVAGAVLVLAGVMTVSLHTRKSAD